ncbi:hypothetical protein MEO40_06920, partial [Dolichospermum sp. ST_sed1]|nr:hypothetical protein [Dolichospermum sp. ST_sed1]
WYTGSSGWDYRLVVESILGIQIQANTMVINPRIPDHWSGFKAQYRYMQTNFQIIVTRVESNAQPSIYLDDVLLDSFVVPLVNDSKLHVINVCWPRGMIL